MTYPLFVIETTASGERQKFEFDINSAPAEFVHYLLRQGLAIIIQRSTSGMGDKTTAEKRAAVERRVAALRRFEVGSAAGGTGVARLDAIEECTRTVLRNLFVRHGVKRTEADKLARDAKRQEHFRDLIVKPNILAFAPDRLAEIDTLTARNWDALVMDEARRMVETMQKPSVQLNLD